MPQANLDALGWEFYEEFDILSGYVHERAINQGPLQRRFKDVYNQILAMRWVLEIICLVYFLMMGKSVNIGYWILQKVIQVHEGKSKRLRFGNTLTAYLLRIDNSLSKPSDRVLGVPEDMLYISNVKAPELNALHKTHSRELLEDVSRLFADEDDNLADLIKDDTKARDKEESQTQGDNDDEEEDEVLADAYVDAEDDD
ncbi:hypothetical protein RND71_003352 [Anisodus tanguticus]|uniref:Uncharacterized protein n=1 Tax=Anisodus tanguticus TaxID=243964 RepID=A0AAE1SWH4_9SOLA|nr:hypothetical protein RND71_003352 [Anisodus tanguticus]